MRIRGILPEARLHFMPAAGRRAARGRALRRYATMIHHHQRAAAIEMTAEGQPNERRGFTTIEPLPKT